MLVIKSIGHSNYEVTSLLEKLAQHSIQTLIDIRSRPYSRWSPQFNKSALQKSLEGFGINYEWRGNNLGGLDKNVMYTETLLEIAKRCEDENICLMCTEREPENCHRSLKIEPDLAELGIKMEHIRYE
jgi:uncharacterized protein (DUF488 family)